MKNIVKTAGYGPIEVGDRQVDGRFAEGLLVLKFRDEIDRFALTEDQAFSLAAALLRTVASMHDKQEQSGDLKA